MTAEARKAWDTNAQFWDEKMGEGNLFHKTLLEPAVLSLLSPQKDERILDVACGNGQLSRTIEALGACVTGCDISENLLKIAASKGGRTDYKIMDACSDRGWSTLGNAAFDKIVSNMALMDMDPIAPFFRGAFQALNAGGSLVISQLHPTFNMPGVERQYRWKPILDQVERQFSINISSYITPRTEWGLAMEGQPVPHPYYVRPLSLILSEAFKAGFVLDGCMEPVFPPDASLASGDETLSSQLLEVYRELPPVIVFRFRKG